MGSHLSGAPRRGGRRGQAVTELALVVPILLLMVVGIMEFGRAWAMSQVITDAARQGARIASLLNDSSAGQDSVRQVVERALGAGRVDPDDAEIDIDRFQDGTDTPVTVTISVRYDFGFFGPVMRIAQQQFDSDPITLRSSAVMRNE